MVSLLVQNGPPGSLGDTQSLDGLHPSAGILTGDLRDIADLRLNEMRRIWKSRPRGGWADQAGMYSQLGEQILRRGEPLFAYDVLIEGTRLWPRDVRLRQLLGLTLARSGAVARGNAVLQALSEEGHEDGETLGILASTCKQLWANAPDPATARRELERAHAVYARAYALSMDKDDVAYGYYNGINAAATALLLGLELLAQNLARQVDRLCRRALANETADPDAYWALATRGESALILEDYRSAADHYAAAARRGAGRHADLGSTRRQARMLLSHRGQDPHMLDACFSIPSVVVFEGCDAGLLRPGPALERSLRLALRDRLEAAGAGFGYASLTGLSDLLFLEEIIALEGEAHVVMPLSPEACLRNLGETGQDAGWKNRFHRALEKATQVHGIGDPEHPNPGVARTYTQMVLDGLGRLHSHALETPLVLMTLANGAETLAPDLLLDRWKECGDSIEPIDIASLAADRQAGVSAEAASTAPPADEPFPQRIMAMLFADVAGYSKLSEREIPSFVRHFMGAVAQLDATSPHRPVLKNTWGDAVYLVFEEIEQAGLFALQLSELIDHIDWQKKGITTPVELRTALHAGPVFVCDDPVVQRTNFCGTHVNWVARIEPVTPPGQVYASQPFAALATAQGVSSFACEYIGQLPLAKGYGDFPLYHVR